MTMSPPTVMIAMEVTFSPTGHLSMRWLAWVVVRLLVLVVRELLLASVVTANTGGVMDRMASCKATVPGVEYLLEIQLLATRDSQSSWPRLWRSGWRMERILCFLLSSAGRLNAPEI